MSWYLWIFLWLSEDLSLSAENRSWIYQGHTTMSVMIYKDVLLLVLQVFTNIWISWDHIFLSWCLWIFLWLSEDLSLSAESRSWIYQGHTTIADVIYLDVSLMILLVLTYIWISWDNIILSLCQWIFLWLSEDLSLSAESKSWIYQAHTSISVMIYKDVLFMILLVINNIWITRDHIFFSWWLWIFLWLSEDLSLSAESWSWIKHLYRS